MSAENTTNTGAQEAENAEKYAVEVKNVTKIYRLYDKPIDRLKESLSVSHKEYHKDFYALSDLSFTVEKGQTVGIIGGTGSGKSSLVHLIPRFYDATDGCVYIKGIPIYSFSRDALLSSVAIVDQKPRLFSGTIRSNMLWGNPNATDEDIWHALETAQAADFVHSKPNGLDEKVLQGGSNFSGGQKQRLTIARALLSKSDILILDDSASALDYATDAALRKAIKALPDNMTVIIVSQRAGSIMNADKILVLDDGSLVGCGTHSELLENCEIYKEIYESQFGTN